MTGILFLYNNLLDTATLTASSADAAFPVSNLKNPFRTKVWRTDGGTPGTADLVINHGSQKAVTCVALVGYSWTSAPGTLVLQFNASDSWGTPSHSETLTWHACPSVNGNQSVIIKTFASQSYQYNRLSVVYATGDWDLAKIYVGAYFAPTSSYRRKYSESIVDPSFLARTIGGQDHIDEITKYRTMNFTCMAPTQAQWELYQAMINHVGISKDLIVAFDYTNEPDEMTIYGKFSSLPGMSRDGLMDLPFTFQESR